MTSTYVFGFPGHGHVIPMLPILAELVRRGERVICFESTPFRNAIQRTGAEFRDYGPAFPLALSHTLERFQKSTADAIQIQLETSRWVLKNLLEPLRQEQPSFLIHDSLSGWGWYLARALNVPTVSLFPTFAFNYLKQQHKPRGFSAQMRALAGRVRHAKSRALADSLRRSYGSPHLDNLAQLMRNRGTLNLIYTSREFQPDGNSFPPDEYKFIGPSIQTRPDAPAFPFEQLDGRPLIYISLGTAFNARPKFHDSCVTAFRNTPYQILIAAGQEINLNVPSNFMVSPFVPQLEILKRAAAFVTHGGMNSINEALYFNVPLVMIPQGGDHGWIAGRAAELGAGIVVSKQEAERDPRFGGQHLRQAVEAILSQPRYAAAAKKIGESLRATGGAAAAADEITKFHHGQGKFA